MHQTVSQWEVHAVCPQDQEELPSNQGLPYIQICLSNFSPKRRDKIQNEKPRFLAYEGARQFANGNLATRWTGPAIIVMYLFEEEVIGEVVEDHRVGGVKGVGFGQ